MTGHRDRARGSVLLVVAVLLLVLSVAALAILHSAIAQQRMATLMQARGVALEQAEAGLRAGEAEAARAFVLGEVGVGCLNGTGACSPVPSWRGGGRCAAARLGCWVSFGAGAGGAGGAYHLQYLGERDISSSSAVRQQLFRVTARAWQPLGGDPVVVSLQSIVVLGTATSAPAMAGPVARRVAWRELRGP